MFVCLHRRLSLHICTRVQKPYHPSVRLSVLGSVLHKDSSVYMYKYMLMFDICIRTCTFVYEYVHAYFRTGLRVCACMHVYVFSRLHVRVCSFECARVLGRACALARVSDQVIPNF